MPTPADITTATLQSWHDAATGVSTSGINVTSWADQSTNGATLSTFGTASNVQLKSGSNPEVIVGSGGYLDGSLATSLSERDSTVVVVGRAITAIGRNSTERTKNRVLANGGAINPFLKSQTDGPLNTYDGSSFIDLDEYFLSSPRLYVFRGEPTGYRVFNGYGWGTLRSSSGTGISTILRLGAITNTDNTSMGFRFNAFATFDGQVSDSEVSSILLPWAAENFNVPSSRPSERIIIVGDSQSSVSRDDTGTNDPAGSWVVQLQDSLNANHEIINITQGSQTISGSGANTLSSRASLVNASISEGIALGQSVHVVLYMGTNDLALNGSTAASVLAQIESYVSNWKAAGVSKVTVIGPLPRGTSGSALQASSKALSDGIRDSTASIDYKILPYDDDLIGGDGANINSTYYDSDKIHLSVLGMERLASLFLEATGLSVGFLDPALLKASWLTTNGDIKPCYTTGSYDGGVAIGAELKPSMTDVNGKLKQCFLNPDGSLKLSLLK